jgi:D-erythronate 2-dehydrogenase
MNLPSINVRVSDMLDALEEVAGSAVRARVKFVRDDRIAGMVANWPAGATAKRAARLGLHPDESFAEIIRQYIADCKATPGGEAALKGLA